jgi:hypothetical protein
MKSLIPFKILFYQIWISHFCQGLPSRTEAGPRTAREVTARHQGRFYGQTHA